MKTSTNDIFPNENASSQYVIRLYSRIEPPLLEDKNSLDPDIKLDRTLKNLKRRKNKCITRESNTYFTRVVDQMSNASSPCSVNYSFIIDSKHVSASTLK